MALSEELNTIINLLESMPIKPESWNAQVKSEIFYKTQEALQLLCEAKKQAIKLENKSAKKITYKIGVYAHDSYNDYLLMQVIDEKYFKQQWRNDILEKLKQDELLKYGASIIFKIQADGQGFEPLIVYTE